MLAVPHEWKFWPLPEEFERLKIDAVKFKKRYFPDAKFKWAEDGWMLREKTERDRLEDEELLSMTGWN